MRRATVSASGFGLVPHEKVELLWTNPSGHLQTLATSTADEHGNFGGLNFTIPDTWADGPQKLLVKGVTSGRAGTATVVVEPAVPGAVPSKYFGKPMSQIQLHGAGYHPGEKIEIYFDSLASAPVGTALADRDGNFPATSVTVPAASAGDHAFLVLGKVSGTPVRVPFSVLAFQPWVGLSDYAPQPETAITVTGQDFAPGERVFVWLDAAQGPPLGVGVANAKGVAKVSGAVIVPYDRRGKVNVVAVGSLSQAPVEATMNVRPYTPLFSLSTYAGPPGSTISAKGTGFGHDEVVTIRLGNGGTGPPSATVRTDAHGDFDLQNGLVIPKTEHDGKLAISAEGEHSQQPAGTAFAVVAAMRKTS
jgi:hypothetical protein